MNKQDKMTRASVVEQKLEGLLYDLDLMPEQCRNATTNMRRIAVEVLRDEIKLYKRTVEHHTKEIKLLTAEIDSKDIEIERTRKDLEYYKDDCERLRNTLNAMSY